MAVAEEQNPRRLRADAARNRQALIDAAQRLFATRGLSVTLDDIAADAGVNVATAYRHFANKHELATAYIQQQTGAALSIAEESAGRADAWQGLTEFLRRTGELIVANRGLHDVLMPGFATDWFEQLDERVRPLLNGLVSRGKKAGQVRRDLEQGDIGVVVQMLTAVIDIPSPDPTALVHRYLELLLAGLRPGGPKLPGSPPTPDALRAAHTAAPRRAPRGRSADK